ncbi:MAG TPA: ThiF family adenylyltransferase [Ktedonobacteraceae bacterium]
MDKYDWELDLNFDATRTGFFDASKPAHRMETRRLFQRVQAAYDLDRMNACRAIYVGTGAAFIEEMARAGIGEHILIDPDVATETDIATQQTYIGNPGKPKVKCIQSRIVKINPGALVRSYPQSLDDIDDETFAELAFTPLRQRIEPVRMGEDWIWPQPHNQALFDPRGQPPKVTLLCGLTDNFFAQARVNRLGLQFGIPSLCTQMYQCGVAAEITFSFPGVTSVCHRCMLSPRYKAYLQEGNCNAVSSDGVPIFATTRLNALTGTIALALLHHGTNHPLWGELLSRIGSRTLVQIRMHADAPLSVFTRVFAGGDTERIFFDEAVWLPQEPDPSCPECRGTGNLLDAKSTFADTRIMHP